jgi:hypothetical protein
MMMLMRRLIVIMIVVTGQPPRLVRRTAALRQSVENAGYPQAGCVVGLPTTLSLPYIPGSSAAVNVEVEVSDPAAIQIYSYGSDPNARLVNISLLCATNGRYDLTIYISNVGEMTPDHARAAVLPLTLYANNPGPAQEEYPTPKPQPTYPPGMCYPMFFEPAQNWMDRCAAAEPTQAQASYQAFDFGHMIWRGDIGMIYVLYDTSLRAFSPPFLPPSTNAISEIRRCCRPVRTSRCKACLPGCGVRTTSHASGWAIRRD